MRASSARIQAEESAMSRRSSARSSRRKKVTLDHPIFTRWPAQYPDRLQLFSAPTPNGVKVGERFGQVARELCPQLLVVFDRLASIEPVAPDIFQVFSLSPSRGRARSSLFALRRPTISSTNAR